MAKKSEAVAFDDLVAFAKSKEDENTRIVKILTSNTIAPESVLLAFAHPVVEKSDKDGFETVDGAFVAYG